MKTNTRLSDLQLVLLAHAARRDDGSIYPLPEAATKDEPRTAKELKSLVRRKLIDEVEVTDNAQSWRADGDLCFGLVLTEAGREALGLGARTDISAPAEPAEANASANPREGSKIARVIALLQRTEGATLGEMVEATGWPPHTTRAALTGLKKKGHTIERNKRGDATCYRIAGEA
jgi:hypothetical protein